MEILIVFGFVGAVYVGASRYREINNYMKLKKMISIDVIENEEFNVLEIENEEDQKVIKYYINRIYKELEGLYNGNSWDNKRFLYSIIKDIDELSHSIEFNRLEVVDMEKIDSIVCIYRLDRRFEKGLEKLIFEWEKRYIG